MSDFESIQLLLVRAARRCRWQRACNGLWLGTFIGALVCLVAVVVYKLAPIPFVVLDVAGIFALACMSAGFIRGWTHRPTLRETARRLDQREKLQERLSTALELAPNATAEGWRALLVSDAAQFAAKLEPRKVFPYKLPRVSRWVLAALALSAGLGFVPEFRTKDYVQKKQDAAAIKEAGKQIVEVTHETLTHRAPVLEPVRKAIENAEQLGLHLDKASLTRDDALKDIANVADKLKTQLQDLDKKDALKTLERAAREPEAGGSSDASNQKMMEDLQKALGKAGENAAALDKLSDKLQKLSAAAQNASKDNSPAAATTRQKLAADLASLAQQAKDLGEPLPNLADAIKDLQNGQIGNFQKDMDLATTDLDKIQKMSQELQQMQEKSSQAGKDLPEQLKFGQPDLAGQSINKMIDKLRSGKLSPEAAAKMLDEVARSIDPAAPYGDASQHLQQAASKLRQGDKAGASQSLAAAAKELEKIQSQMADAKSLQASLDALNKAEASLATHGQCTNAGNSACRSLGTGKGKGGHGVGTWTDDDSQLYPEMSGLWDNSGINRPDSDPRGKTDRGDPSLADNLDPTRLHGQIAPGSPMPSITLKGVSIKGQSSVGYTEAVTTAQTDARNALNQDQVPRAYQGAVKDYFNDLKP